MLIAARRMLVGLAEILALSVVAYATWCASIDRLIQATFASRRFPWGGHTSVRAGSGRSESPGRFAVDAPVSHRLGTATSPRDRCDGVYLAGLSSSRIGDGSRPR